MAEQLEQKVQKRSITSLSLEEYKKLFANKYQQFPDFRDIVHKELKLSKLKLFTLDMTKKIWHSKYQKTTAKLVNEYAIHIYDRLKEFSEVKEEAEQLQDVQVEKDSLEKKLEETERVLTETERQKCEIEQKKQTEQQRLNDEYKLRMAEIKSDIDEKIEDVEKKLDPEEIARRKVAEHLVASAGFKINEDEVTYDEEKIIGVIENLFLNEILNEIATETGDSGFLAKSKETYESVIDHWDEMDDYGEIDDVDWVETIINTRTQGYELPVLPQHFIVGKYERENLLRRKSIDTAIALDTSGSMRDNHRLDMGKKTALALSAYMRRMNKQNNTTMARFSSDLEEVTSAAMYRDVFAGGGTETHMALDWLYKTLNEKGPSIAYLVTDGYPASNQNDAIPMAIESAKKFASNPYIMLRIFLIDPDSDSLQIVKEIGKAAGPGTKFVPVKARKLGSGLITDVASAFGEMYEIGNN